MNKIYQSGRIYTLIINGEYVNSIMPHYNKTKAEIMQDISKLYNIDVESIETIISLKEKFLLRLFEVSKKESAIKVLKNLNDSKGI